MANIEQHNDAVPRIRVTAAAEVVCGTEPKNNDDFSRHIFSFSRVTAGCTEIWNGIET